MILGYSWIMNSSHPCFRHKKNLNHVHPYSLFDIFGLAGSNNSQRWPDQNRLHPTFPLSWHAITSFVSYRFTELSTPGHRYSQVGRVKTCSLNEKKDAAWCCTCNKSMHRRIHWQCNSLHLESIFFGRTHSLVLAALLTRLQSVSKNLKHLKLHWYHWYLMLLNVINMSLMNTAVCFQLFCFWISNDFPVAFSRTESPWESQWRVGLGLWRSYSTHRGLCGCLAEGVKSLLAWRLKADFALFYIGLIWTYINLSWFIMTPCILCRRSSACSMIWFSLIFNDIMSTKISKSTRVRLSLWVANVAKPWHSGRSELSLDWPAGRIGMIRARWKSEEIQEM